MRLLFGVFVCFLTLQFSAAAQMPFTVRAFEQGTEAARAREFETALEKYRQAILLAEAEKTSDDFRARIHFNLGVCLYKLKQSSAAVEEFTEAIKLSGRDYQKAFYALGMAQSELKNWRKAEIAFRNSIELKKDDGEAWFDLGLVLVETKDYAAAVTAFKKAIEYKSRASADAHNNLGVIFALKADFPAAEVEFQTALIKSNNKSIEAGNNLQFCRLHKRNFNRQLLAKFEFSKIKSSENAD